MFHACRCLLLTSLAVILPACSAGPIEKPTAPPEKGSRTGAVGRARPVDASATKAATDDLPQPLELSSQELGPGVLLPGKADDAEVMNVGGISVRKSHLYDRFFELNPLGTKLEVDWIVFDILVARQAKHHKVFVDTAAIDKQVKDALAVLEEQIKSDWNGQVTLDQFLLEERGVDRKLYRRLARRRLARQWLRYYVVRYLASLEDRVRVRIISHRDKATVESILKKVREGADFRSLALSKSEHPTNSRGGLLPPFRRDSGLKFSKPAFALKAGDVSDILSIEENGVTQHYLLFCVEHLPGRKRPFKEVKGELDRDRARSPLTEEEKLDLYRRLRSASETLPKRDGNR